MDLQIVGGRVDRIPKIGEIAPFPLKFGAFDTETHSRQEGGSSELTDAMREGAGRMTTKDVADLGQEQSPSDRLIEEHLALVDQVLNQVVTQFPRHVEREELARAGSLGLVEAARRFDVERGVPFAAFAARRIRGAMLDAVRAIDWAPRSVRRMSREFEQTEQVLAGQLGERPDVETTAAAMGVTTSDVHRLRAKLERASVLALDYATVDLDGDTITLGQSLADESTPSATETLETREMLGYLREAIALLPERHRIVVTGYFLEGATSAELADLLGVTESRISQIRSESTDMLRDAIAAQYRDGDPATDPSGARRAGRVESLAEAISAGGDWRGRLAESPLEAAAAQIAV